MGVRDVTGCARSRSETDRIASGIRVRNDRLRSGIAATLDHDPTAGDHIGDMEILEWRCDEADVGTFPRSDRPGPGVNSERLGGVEGAHADRVDGGDTGFHGIPYAA